MDTDQTIILISTLVTITMLFAGLCRLCAVGVRAQRTAAESVSLSAGGSVLDAKDATERALLTVTLDQRNCTILNPLVIAATAATATATAVVTGADAAADADAVEVEVEVDVRRLLELVQSSALRPRILAAVTAGSSSSSADAPVATLQLPPEARARYWEALLGLGPGQGLGHGLQQVQVRPAGGDFTTPLQQAERDIAAVYSYTIHYNAHINARADLVGWDVSRCKFIEWREGEGGRRLASLLRAWQRRHPHLRYKQCLSVLAPPILHVFAPLDTATAAAAAAAGAAEAVAEAEAEAEAVAEAEAEARVQLYRRLGRALLVFERVTEVWLGTLLTPDEQQAAAAGTSAATSAATPAAAAAVSISEAAAVPVYRLAEALRVSCSLLPVLAYWEPQLAVLLSDAEAEPEMYALPFFTTLYADNLSLSDLLPVWDVLFATAPDPRLPSFLAVAALQTVRQQLLAGGHDITAVLMVLSQLKEGGAHVCWSGIALRALSLWCWSPPSLGRVDDPAQLLPCEPLLKPMRLAPQLQLQLQHDSGGRSRVSSYGSQTSVTSITFQAADDESTTTTTAANTTTVASESQSGTAAVVKPRLTVSVARLLHHRNNHQLLPTTLQRLLLPPHGHKGTAAAVAAAEGVAALTRRCSGVEVGVKHAVVSPLPWLHALALAASVQTSSGSSGGSSGGISGAGAQGILQQEQRRVSIFSSTNDGGGEGGGGGGEGAAAPLLSSGDRNRDHHRDHRDHRDRDRDQEVGRGTHSRRGSVSAGAIASGSGSGGGGAAAVLSQWQPFPPVRLSALVSLLCRDAWSLCAALLLIQPSTPRGYDGTAAPGLSPALTSGLSSGLRVLVLDCVSTTAAQHAAWRDALCGAVADIMTTYMLDCARAVLQTVGHASNSSDSISAAAAASGLTPDAAARAASALIRQQVTFMHLPDSEEVLLGSSSSSSSSSDAAAVGRSEVASRGSRSSYLQQQHKSAGSVSGSGGEAGSSSSDLPSTLQQLRLALLKPSARGELARVIDDACVQLGALRSVAGHAHSHSHSHSHHGQQHGQQGLGQGGTHPHPHASPLLQRLHREARGVPIMMYVQGMDVEVQRRLHAAFLRADIPAVAALEL